MMDREYDVLFRIMILGDTGVGKTCMLQRFCDNEFRYSHVCTIGIDFKMKTLVMDGIRVRVQIWDTAGQERYRTITRQYFRKAQGIILAYDITNKDSFFNVRNWAADIAEFAEDDVCVVLVGNKSDREDSRVVTSSHGQELASELDMPFTELSAYTSENVSEMFGQVTQLVLDKHKEEILSSMRDRNIISPSESEGSDFGSSEDEGIVKDLEPKGSSQDSRNIKPKDFSCCHIL